MKEAEVAMVDGVEREVSGVVIYTVWMELKD